MSTTLQNELDELRKLPEDEQEYIAGQLAKWRKLRTAIANARAQIAEGEAVPLDAEEIIRKARAQYGKA